MELTGLGSLHYLQMYLSEPQHNVLITKLNSLSAGCKVPGFFHWQKKSPSPPYLASYLGLHSLLTYTSGQQAGFIFFSIGTWGL